MRNFFFLILSLCVCAVSSSVRLLSCPCRKLDCEDVVCGVRRTEAHARSLLHEAEGPIKRLITRSVSEGPAVSWPHD